MVSHNWGTLDSPVLMSSNVQTSARQAFGYHVKPESTVLLPVHPSAQPLGMIGVASRQC